MGNKTEFVTAGRHTRRTGGTAADTCSAKSDTYSARLASGAIRKSRLQDNATRKKSHTPKTGPHPLAPSLGYRRGGKERLGSPFFHQCERGVGGVRARPTVLLFPVGYNTPRNGEFDSRAPLLQHNAASLLSNRRFRGELILELR